LHWGNILIRECVDDGDFIYQNSNHATVTIKNEGLKVTLIDFTLSRLETEENVEFVDLQRDHFTGQGDIQFDVYRLMKDHCPCNDWSIFNPKTNVMVTIQNCLLTAVVELLD